MKNTLYGVPLGVAAAGSRDEEVDAPVLAEEEGEAGAEAGVDPPPLALVVLLLLLHAAAVTATTAAPAISARRFIEPTNLCQGAAMSGSIHPVMPRHPRRCTGLDP
jgi:hypothetical protein